MTPLSEHLYEQLVPEVLLTLKFVVVVRVLGEEVAVVVIIILHGRAMKRAQRVEVHQLTEAHTDHLSDLIR